MEGEAIPQASSLPAVIISRCVPAVNEFLPIEDRDHAGKRRAVSAVSEFQAAAHKANLRFPVDVIMEPARIRPRGQQHDHRRAALSGFFDPFADPPTIGRIAPDVVPPNFFGARPAPA